MTDHMINYDGILHITLMGGEARALLVESTQTVERARALFGLSRTATAALGRTLTATAMVSCMLKGADQSVTVRVAGDGPLGGLLAVGRPDGSVKGYVEHGGIEIARRPDGKLDVGGAVGHKGTLTVIKDLRMREPYVGQVPLASGEIAEDFAMYFTSSEQTPSLVSLGVLVGDDVIAAGGLLIQMMPGASEAAIRSVETSVGLFADISSAIRTDHLEGTMAQLLTHLEPVVVDKTPIRYHCDCSRQNIERALIALGKKELTDMIETQGGAEVDCHFCCRRERFTADDLRTLLEQARPDHRRPNLSILGEE